MGGGAGKGLPSLLQRMTAMSSRVSTRRRRPSSETAQGDCSWNHHYHHLGYQVGGADFCRVCVGGVEMRWGLYNSFHVVKERGQDSIMVLAWYMDDSSEDQRLPHKPANCEEVSLNQLAAIGVLYWKISAEDYESNEELQKIRSDRGYNYSDVIAVSPKTLPNYEQKIKMFFEEHIHQDEEIRFILEGSGYFDVRDKQDRWIRIQVEQDDLLILPAGIYHRFTLDTKNYIKALRLFQGEPVWTPINRPADSHQARLNYLAKVQA